jgi:uncharacterized protein YrrD
MEFKQGMSVKTPHGETVGHIDQIVVNPTNHEITHIVVRKGFLFTEDRVIPVDLLTSLDKDTVTLHAHQLDEFPTFESSYYVLPNGEYTAEIPGGWTTAPLYYYPPAGMAPYPYYDPVPRGTVERVTRNVPPETVTIGRGTNVTTRDGDHAGHVEQVYTDDNGQITHILVSKGFIFTSEKLIPITWITTMSDNEVRLQVSNQVLESLPEYQHS